MVDTRTWTSGGGNTFPGADVPFGQVQWSPDTMPNNNAGGGYSYGDSELWGYSLTHVSGPGCGAAGDVPILPMTGALPSGDPNNATTSFTNTGEIAQAGYYSADSNMPSTITSEFTATPHSSMGRFTFPKTTSADFLVKLMASQNGDSATSATVVGNNEIMGSDTSGNFCGETDNDGQVQQYTVYFDIVFNHPFTASQIITESGQTDPDSVFLTFNTTSSPVIDAKVGISYVSTANAKQNWQTENPGWNFDAVRSAAQADWNNLLSKIDVSGGTASQTQQFYSLLYKDLLQPNITSDVNGQYMGSNGQVATLAPGQQNQYGIFSGWDDVCLLAVPAPGHAGSEGGQRHVAVAGQLLLPGRDPAAMGISAAEQLRDGRRPRAVDHLRHQRLWGAGSSTPQDALADMLQQATTTNDVRPGEALEQQLGYLPEDGNYGCCNAARPRVGLAGVRAPRTSRWPTSPAALGDGYLRRDNADKNQGRTTGSTSSTAPATCSTRGTRTARSSPATGLPGGTFATDGSHYVEGDAYEYTWDVPNNYPALFSLLGGKSKVISELKTYLSQPEGFGMYAQLTNEFDFGEQFALNYAGDPAGTQQAVNNIRNTIYGTGPSGLDNNDDLGANSSSFIWEMLGMYPENSGSNELVFASPGFPHAGHPPAQGHHDHQQRPRRLADPSSTPSR